MTRFVLALLAGLAVAACETVEAENVREAEVENPVYHVTLDRSGQTVNLALGQVLALVLPNTAGSSSHWTPIVSDPTVLVQRGSRATLAPRSGGILIGGAAGYERIEFQTRRTGTSAVRATRQKSPREGGGTAVFEIMVVVGGG